jgi:hypothetical protein
MKTIEFYVFWTYTANYSEAPLKLSTRLLLSRQVSLHDIPKHQGQKEKEHDINRVIVNALSSFQEDFWVKGTIHIFAPKSGKVSTRTVKACDLLLSVPELGYERPSIAELQGKVFKAKARAEHVERLAEERFGRGKGKEGKGSLAEEREKREREKKAS